MHKIDTITLSQLVFFGMVVIFMLGMAVVIFFITYQSRILKQNQEHQLAELKHQKELLYAVINSQEKERQRIGMDLHDEVGSSLSSLRMIMENFIEKITDTVPKADVFCTQSKTIIDNVIINVRNISHNLSPLGKGTYELIDALEDLKDNVNRTGNIQMDLNIDSIDFNKINSTEALALFRVFSELINNTLKHAQASYINLSACVVENNITFNYKDNGVGLQQNLNKPKSGMGMQNIESRLNMLGAYYKLNDSNNSGFEINISLHSQ